MARFSFVSPGAMAGSAIQEELVRRQMMERQAMLDEQRRQEAEADRAARQQQLMLNAEEQNLRRQQMTQTAAERAAAAERQRQLDARAASKAANEYGVRQMIGEAINQGPMTPESARQIASMAYREDMEMPGIVAEAMKPPKPAEPYTLPPNATRFGPNNEVIARGVHMPPTSAAQSTPQVWVIREGMLTPIERGTAQPGDEPFDPVSARQQTGMGAEAEAIDTVTEARRLASTLRNHPGLPGAFGVYSSKLPTFTQSTADAEVLLKSLQSLLTLENTGKLKGVLSNADMEVLRRASTTLAAEMSEPAARAELDRLVGVMDRAATALANRPTGARRPGVPTGPTTPAPATPQGGGAAGADGGWSPTNRPGVRIRKKAAQ